MNKMKSFFTGIFLLAAILAMVLVTSLIYNASERSSVKSYIFEMANNSSQRVGMLQNLGDMSESDLRNKLIKKYVSEYFKVIPGDKNIMDRRMLQIMSGDAAFEYWRKNEAKIITEMSNQKMFRLARVADDGIAIYNIAEDKTPDNSQTVYYKVKYYTSTWSESNVLETEPVYDQGTIYLEIAFKPGIRQTIRNKRYDIRKHLESGQNPAGLFQFRVVNIGDKNSK
jgi:hypothetical protein